MSEPGVALALGLPEDGPWPLGPWGAPVGEVVVGAVVVAMGAPPPRLDADHATRWVRWVDDAARSRTVLPARFAGPMTPENLSSWLVDRAAALAQRLRSARGLAQLEIDLREMPRPAPPAPKGMGGAWLNARRAVHEPAMALDDLADRVRSRSGIAEVVRVGPRRLAALARPDERVRTDLAALPGAGSVSGFMAIWANFPSASTGALLTSRAIL